MRLIAASLPKKKEHYAPHGPNPKEERSTMRLMALTLRRRRVLCASWSLTLRRRRVLCASWSLSPKEERSYMRLMVTLLRRKRRNEQKDSSEH